MLFLLGHFGICVPNYKEAMDRFRELGCEIIENPGKFGCRACSLV